MRCGTRYTIYTKYLATGEDRPFFIWHWISGFMKKKSGFYSFFEFKSTVRMGYGAENYLKMRCSASYTMYKIFSDRGDGPFLIWHWMLVFLKNQVFPLFWVKKSDTHAVRCWKLSKNAHKVKLLHTNLTSYQIFKKNSNKLLVKTNHIYIRIVNYCTLSA